MGDCIVQASIVERQNKYEKYWWYLAGGYVALSTTIFIIAVSSR